MDSDNHNISEHILAEYLLGDLSPEMIQQVEQWLSESEDNRKYFEKMEALWMETGKLDPAPVAVDVESAWNKVSGKTGLGDKKRADIKEKTGSRTLYYFVRIAAVIIIVTGIVSVIMLFNQEHPETIVQSQAEKIEHRLPDGSTITLNNNSEIHYKEDYNSTSRTVEISGEAYFEVKPDATRPFIVQAGEASVRALGTSFNVRAMENADEISVNVSTGKVQFYHVEEKTGDTASVTLNPGEKGIFNRMTGMIWKVAVAAPADLFWKTKELIFRRTALSTVLEILDSTYHVTIVLKNEKMKDCPYTSSFKDNKIEEIIETIAETYRLNVIREDKRYVLEGGECE